MAREKSTRGLLRTLLVVAGCASLVGAAPADAQEPAPAPPPHLAEPPTARFDWSVPERYALGWNAWNEQSEHYRTSYVRPARWSVSVDACSSSGGSLTITDYDVTIAGVGFDFRTRSHDTGCRRVFDNLPRLGKYDVTTVVRTSGGASSPRTLRIELRDHLIVSLGDSMASGEGVPDESGVYTSGSTLTQTLGTLSRIFNGDVRLHTEVAAEWKNRRCHRSARSGHALAAWALERRDPKSSVTYISLACSGAEIAHVIDTEYAGIQPLPNSGKVPPQLDALRGLVGAGQTSRGRTVDAVLLSIGVNDLGFSDIVQSCATNFNTVHGDGDPYCVYDSDASAKLTPGGSIDQSYARLGSALRDRLDVAEVYITDYPGAPFGQSRGGCGLLGIPEFGIASREATAMAQVGLQLYWATGRAASASGWNWVPGMSKAFTGHDYCAATPYLVSLESSLLRQGTIFGAVHPTRTGHATFANLLLDSVVFRPALPHWRAKLVVRSVRVDSGVWTARSREAQEPDPGDTGEPVPPPPPSDRFSFGFSVRTIPNWPGATTHSFTVQKTDTGRWISVPSELGTFELDVYDAPRPPRHATAVDFLTYGPGGTLPGYYTQAQRFGLGCHEQAHPAAGWAIRYRIEVRLVGGGPTAPGGQLPPCVQYTKT